MVPPQPTPQAARVQEIFRVLLHELRGSAISALLPYLKRSLDTPQASEEKAKLLEAFQTPGMQQLNLITLIDILTQDEELQQKKPLRTHEILQYVLLTAQRVTRRTFVIQVTDIDEKSIVYGHEEYIKWCLMQACRLLSSPKATEIRFKTSVKEGIILLIQIEADGISFSPGKLALQEELRQARRERATIPLVTGSTPIDKESLLMAAMDKAINLHQGSMTFGNLDHGCFFEFALGHHQEV